MTSPNFMVIGLQIRKLHRGGAPPFLALLDSKKPGLLRVKVWSDVEKEFHMPDQKSVKKNLKATSPRINYHKN